MLWGAALLVVILGVTVPIALDYYSRLIGG